MNLNIPRWRFVVVENDVASPLWIFLMLVGDIFLNYITLNYLPDSWMWVIFVLAAISWVVLTKIIDSDVIWWIIRDSRFQGDTWRDYQAVIYLFTLFTLASSYVAVWFQSGIILPFNIVSYGVFLLLAYGYRTIRIITDQTEKEYPGDGSF